MTDEAIVTARADIEATGDLLERALKLSGQMMAAALKDADFDWTEAERLAALRAFSVLPQMRKLKEEIANA